MGPGIQPLVQPPPAWLCTLTGPGFWPPSCVPLQISGFAGSLRGTAVQQRAAGGSRAAAPQLVVRAAGTQTATKRLKVAPKPAPPPPRKTVAGTKKIKATVSGTGTKKVGGTKTVGGTKAVKAIEVFSSEKTFRQKQDTTRAAPKVLR